MNTALEEWPEPSAADREFGAAVWKIIVDGSDRVPPVHTNEAYSWVTENGPDKPYPY